ncbi:intermediate filament protein ON3-like [Varanus komodoensis]|uniref:intermediate filament protein ON3-like n=1 Tax=Varanus komodoensis TaxID=61221 RepID=UPI001CF7EA7C|nr:intermediate filament protein ON3-like [Varanus komodoensis]
MYGGCNTSRSFHNFGRTHRISSARHWGDGLHETSINKHLLEPLHLGIDPHDQQRKAREKEQMKDLNNQFAGFIDKVRVLEQRNQMLATKWELLQSHKLPLAQKDLRPLCESFISSLEKKLDCLLCEKSRLESQHETMKNLIEDSREKYEDEVNRRTQAENDFVLLKKEVDDAFEHQKELEMKKELLSEQIHFLRNFFVQELAVLDQQHCDISVLVNMDNSRGFNMDALIQNVESWYQTVARRSKEEINLFYKNQMNDLQQKQGHFHEDLKHNQREIAELNRQIQMVQCQAEREKKKVSSLQASIAGVEEHGSRALKDARARQRELQNQLQSHKNNLASLLRNYQDLLNNKMALDIEITAYRTLLEGEEQRICAGAPVSLGKESEDFFYFLS